MRLYAVLVLCTVYAKHVNASWDCTFFEGEGSIEKDGKEVKVTNSNGANILCRYMEFEINSGKYSFCLNMEGNKPRNMIGLATDEDFKGNDFKGCFYNGGLGHNPAVNTFFVPFFGDIFNFRDDKSDKICFAIEASNNNLKVYLKHQYTSLGLAFDIDGQKLPLYPTVWFRTNGKAVLEDSIEFDNFPKTRQPLKVGGMYELTQFTENDEDKPELLNKCKSKDITFTIINYGLADVATEEDEIKPNIFSVEYGKHKATIDRSKGSWKSTYESPDIPKNECNRFLRYVLKNINSLTYENENVIIITSEKDGDVSKMFKCQRKTSIEFSPVNHKCNE